MFHAQIPMPEKGCFYPPTLITGLEPRDRLMQEEIFGPVLVATTFRTPEEAVALANNTRYGLAATVWTENVNLALDVAPKLVAGVVWVNATNLFDAAAGFGGVRESGFGREGGWEGLSAYTKPKGSAKALKPVAAVADPGDGAVEGIDRTAKLYVGGKQARPDGGYSPGGVVAIGQAPRPCAAGEPEGHPERGGGGARGKGLGEDHGASPGAGALLPRREPRRARGGVRGAAAATSRAATGGRRWRRPCSGCSPGRPGRTSTTGAAKGVPIRGIALAMNEPVGVIGVICPDEAPLLGLVSTVAPAVAMGNRVVAVASEPFPLAATDFYQVLDTSDVPGGVVNILTGSHRELAPQLAGHMDVDAVWCFSSTDLSGVVEKESAGDAQADVGERSRRAGLVRARGRGAGVPEAATEVKTVWVPYGE